MPEITDAILSLRQKLGLSQKAFGELLNVSTQTVLRYEGGQHPSRKILLTLARMSGQAEMNDLAELFTATRDKQIEGLASTGSAPRIPKKELAFWEALLKQISGVAGYMIAGLRSGVLTTEYAVTSLAEVAGMADRVRSQMRPYLPDPPKVLKSLNEFSGPAQEHIAGLNAEPETVRARELSAKINARNREIWSQQSVPDTVPAEAPPANELRAASIQKRVPARRKKH